MNVAWRSSPEATESATATEVLVRFGPESRLTGVLGGAHGTGPVLLLPSAGLQPRAGPFRLHADLADRLASSGIRSFRFDVPGVGEAPRLTGCDEVGATIAAIDRLESDHGCKDFVVGGVCSSGDTGWAVANLDPRVSAVLLLDGVVYTGPWYQYARALSLLRRVPGEWRRFLRAVPRKFRGNAGLDPDDFRAFPEHARTRQEFAELVQRDVRLMFIFSGAYEDRFLHPRQFEWSFGPVVHDRRVTMHFWPDCDHTYFGGVHRERLIATIERWMLGLAAGNVP